MKQLFKKFLFTLAIVFSVAGAITTTATLPVSAAPQSSTAANPSSPGGNLASRMNETDFSCRYFLGMTSWDCGLQAENGGLGNIDSEEELKEAIVIILANVLADLSVIAAYLVLGFVIYGGYLYIFSSGDPGKIQNSKKTLTRAFIGLAIVTLSNVILNAARFAFLSGSTTFQDCRNSSTGEIIQCIEPTTVITNTLQWFIGTAGVVALIFVVVGGVGYVTSAGDPSKLQKSKNTILYALVGLVIVAIAELLVSFISSIINGANPV